MTTAIVSVVVVTPPEESLLPLFPLDKASDEPELVNDPGSSSLCQHACFPPSKHNLQLLSSGATRPLSPGHVESTSMPPSSGLITVK